MKEAISGVIKTQGRTITECDISLFASMTWMTSDLHTDKEAMRDSRYGERSLPGPVLLACAIGLSQGLVRALVKEWGVKFWAVIEIDKVRFHDVVLPGDTISVESKVTVQPSEVGRTSQCTLVETVSKQGGVKVCEFIRTSLVRRFEEPGNVDTLPRLMTAN